ncbi:MAG TPA: glycoside hydrolase family 27 protein [Candidatus Synoicihabitans sp.]|nr:glycoside hydrolase family 27 protein [Candidatus Synoicihabitans sp.]
MQKLLFLVLALLAASLSRAQKFEGLALTPPMGWNSWNTFAGNINEAVVRETADAMIRNGMRDAGYTYIVIDDTWSLKQRDADGNLVADPEKFPSGMKALGDWLHDRCFKFGIYSCAGRLTCGGYPGSWGHEFQDARTFASWGVDYLKYDWCYTETADARDAYKRMRDALYAAGRPVVFSICEWGTAKPWEWAQDVGHLWRTTGDIYDSYDGRKGWEMGWKRILDLQYELVQSATGPDGIAKAAGPGHWNDPDMMEVGSAGLTFAESRAHFGLWAILAAPLMAGNDVRHMAEEIRALLTNRDVLAINQDKLGKQGYRVLAEPAKNVEIWVRELENKEWAVAVLNTSKTAEELTVNWGYFHWFLHGTYTIHDIWANQAAGDTSQPFRARVESHDIALLRLKPLAARAP